MRLAFSMCVLVFGAGCTARPGLHERMTAAVAPGGQLQQVQLAHIGHIDTADGRYEVAIQRLVITGMLAPRGQTNLRLFTPAGRLVATYSLTAARPLWCEGGRIYLAGFGHIAGIPTDPRLAGRFEPDEVPTGNVVDFSRGLKNPFLTRETRYGSSGGIEDVTCDRSEKTPVSCSV